MSGARFLVGGKVQGVWFRAATREQALALHLKGFARNLPDSRVEVVAVGSDASLDTLERWLRHGPPMANVTELTREQLSSAIEFQGFSTL